MNKKKYHVYCDESGVVKEDYLVIGGFAIEDKIRRNIIKDIIKIKREGEFKSMKNWEIKAEKCNNDIRLRLYIKILKKFFEYNFTYKATTFKRGTYNHSIFYNTEKENPKESRPEEKGFYAFYKTMLYHSFIKDSTADSSFFVSIDERNNSQNAIYTDWIETKLNEYDPIAKKVKLVEEYSSKKCILLQIADLITYSVSFYWNSNRDVKNQYKISLAKTIATLFNEKELSTNKNKSNLIIWECKFNKK